MIRSHKVAISLLTCLQLAGGTWVSYWYSHGDGEIKTTRGTLSLSRMALVLLLSCLLFQPEASPQLKPVRRPFVPT